MRTSFRIVAANGAMSSPLGWTRPVIGDGDRCCVLGADSRCTFPATELQRLAGEGLITLLSPFDFTVDGNLDKQFLSQVDHEEQKFSVTAYILYWRPELFRLGDLLPAPPNGSQCRIDPSVGRHSSQVAFAVTRVSLLTRLQDQFRLFDERFRQFVAAHDWSALPSLDDEYVALLADSMFDIAYSKSTGERAITLLTLLTLLGPNSDVLEEWLPVACERWGLKSTTDLWTRKARVVLTGCMMVIAELHANQERACPPPLSTGKTATIHDDLPPNKPSERQASSNLLCYDVLRRKPARNTPAKSGVKYSHA